MWSPDHIASRRPRLPFRWSPAIAVLLLLACTTRPTAALEKKPGGLFRRPAVTRVVVVILENENGGVALEQPFLKKLASSGAYLSNYYALAHPSQPNYIGLVSGSIDGVQGNRIGTLNRRHLGDLLSEKRLTWKSYAEDYPGGCDLRSHIRNYVRRHEPFLSFKDVQEGAACANVRPGEEFDRDVQAGLANFVLYVPNNDHNGHDTGVKVADRWLRSKFEPLLTNKQFMKGTLLVVTFDEAENRGPNKIYTVLYGDSVTPGVYDDVYDHYDLLRTIEEIFGLGTLGQHDAAAAARPITKVWR
ncbi:MAG TPA: alkaline phosphatase family protein [Thermoanaerobaculia bacterium]|nr:alkaline phosphatase family protein [Thermoanaerobaculia bacterium]